MTPAHVINNLTSINLANLLRLMNCVSESLTTSLCSIFLIVKASSRPFRILSFNSDLCGASKLYFYFVLICGSGVSHVPDTGLLCGWLFSPLLYGPDLWQSILVCGLHNPFCQCGQHCFLEHFAARQATCFWCLDDCSEKRSSESQTNTT